MKKMIEGVENALKMNLFEEEVRLFS